MAVETEKEHVTCSKVSVELSSGIRKTAHLSKILNDLRIPYAFWNFDKIQYFFKNGQEMELIRFKQFL